MRALHLLVEFSDNESEYRDRNLASSDLHSIPSALKLVQDAGPLICVVVGRRGHQYYWYFQPFQRVVGMSWAWCHVKKGHDNPQVGDMLARHVADM